MIRRIHSTALTAAAALVVAMTLSTGVHAQGDGAARHDRFGRGAFPGLGQLDLSDAQRQQVRDVMQRYGNEMREAGTRLRDAHEVQRAAVDTVPVNEGLIRSTSQTLANAQTDMALLQARIHSDVWSLLTAEQQERAKQLKAQRQDRAKQRLQQRRQPRQQG